MSIVAYTVIPRANSVFTQVSSVEQEKYANELAAAYRRQKGESEPASEKYYKVGTISSTSSIGAHIASSKVKWTRVLDLVEKRKIFLKGGWAYVPSREQSSIVFQEFESQLEKALEVSIICSVMKIFWPDVLL